MTPAVRLVDEGHLLPPVAQVKLAIMAGIDSQIRSQFTSQHKAAQELEIEVSRLSKLRNAQYERFSLEWLVVIATNLGAKLTVKVE